MKEAEKLKDFIHDQIDTGMPPVRIDIHHDYMGSWDLPNIDYDKELIREFRTFNLYAMDLYEVCITKLARYDGSDERDIINVIQGRGNISVSEWQKVLGKYLPHLRKDSETTRLLVRGNFDMLMARISFMLIPLDFVVGCNACF